MKLLRLLISISLILYSLQGCNYFKAVPKSLNSIFTGYKPYSLTTHFEQSNTLNTDIDTDAQAEEITQLGYSDCQNVCEDNGDCMIECLSFKQVNIITYYFYKVNNDDCTSTEMDKVFHLSKKQCQYVQSGKGNSFEFLANGMKIVYNFRSGNFEMVDKSGDGKSEDVVIKLAEDNDEETFIWDNTQITIPQGNTNTASMKDGTYSISINAKTIIEGSNHYCFNALTEINKEYKQTSTKECNNINFQPINKNAHYNINDSNFLDYFDFDFTAINLLDINKRLVNLKVMYESRNDINYYFKFDSHQCFDLFLTFVNVLNCSSETESNIYPFLFKEKNNEIFMYYLNLKTLQVNKKNSHFKQKNGFKFKSLQVKNNKVIFNILEGTFEVDIITNKFDTCLLNLEKFEKMDFIPLTKDGLSDSHKGRIFQISKNIISYYYPNTTEKSFWVTNFKVWHKDNELIYELYNENGEMMNIKTRQNFVKELSVGLCDLKKNEFYFYKTYTTPPRYGKISIENDLELKVEYFGKKGKDITISSKDFSLHFGPNETWFKVKTPLNYDENLIYSDPICRKILQEVNDSIICNKDYQFFAKRTNFLSMNNIDSAYVEPAVSKELHSKFREDVNGLPKSSNFAILNLLAKKNISMVQLISKKRDGDGLFDVVKYWFKFDNDKQNNNATCQKYLSQFIQSFDCDRKFFWTENALKNKLPSGQLKFIKGNKITRGPKKVSKYEKIEDQGGKVYKKMIITKENDVEPNTLYLIIPLQCSKYVSELENNVGQNSHKKFIR
jgi:hypothetical protein